MSQEQLIKSEKRSEFKVEDAEFQYLTAELWAVKKAKADYVINIGVDEIVYGKNLEIGEEEIMLAEDMAAKKKDNDRTNFADPGYQSDKKKRYPLGPEVEKIRSAWNYIHQKRNADKYTPQQLARIKSRIISEWKKRIDKDGPPSAKEE
jgi:hypothetical protein